MDATRLACGCVCEALSYLMNMLKDPAHFGQCHSYKVGLDCVRKLTEQAKEGKASNSRPLWALLQSSCLGFT